MIGDVSGMGVLVCSNELTKGAGNVGCRNQLVVPVILVCDTKTSLISCSDGLGTGFRGPSMFFCRLCTLGETERIPRTAQSSLIPITRPLAVQYQSKACASHMILFLACSMLATIAEAHSSDS